MTITDSSCIDLNEIEVRRSSIHGLGAFARRGMQRGHLVGRYEGRRYGANEEGQAQIDHGLTYLFGLSDGSLIDGAQGGNATRHINHSCSPNCEAVEEQDDDGEIHIVIRTLRRIKAREELFIDYRLDVPADDLDGYPCHCGVTACRGTMAAPADS